MAYTQSLDRFYERIVGAPSTQLVPKQTLPRNTFELLLFAPYTYNVVFSRTTDPVETLSSIQYKHIFTAARRFVGRTSVPISTTLR